MKVSLHDKGKVFFLNRWSSYFRGFLRFDIATTNDGSLDQGFILPVLTIHGSIPANETARDEESTSSMNAVYRFLVFDGGQASCGSSPYSSHISSRQRPHFLEPHSAIIYTLDSDSSCLSPREKRREREKTQPHPGVRTCDFFPLHPSGISIIKACRAPTHTSHTPPSTVPRAEHQPASLRH